MRKSAVTLSVFLMLSICIASGILWADQSPLQQFGDFVGEKMGLQPKTLYTNYGKAKIIWASGGVDLQLIFETLPPALVQYANGERAPSWNGDFKVIFLDKDGFEVLSHDGYFSKVTNYGAGAILRDHIYCSMGDYRRITSATIEVN